MHPVDVLLFLTHGDSVLLALRSGTGYADQMWNLPSGKLEIMEDAVSALLRETREEIGVDLDPDEPRLAATVHHRNTVGLGRIGLVFAVEYVPARHGTPVNAEPNKCAKIEWFPVDRLPVSTYPYSAAAVSACLREQPLRLSGWEPVAAGTRGSAP
jgi:ADP-ribose pyrophosphatase YjhB (NUDIX family)